MTEQRNRERDLRGGEVSRLHLLLAVGAVVPEVRGESMDAADVARVLCQKFASPKDLAILDVTEEEVDGVRFSVECVATSL